MYFLIKSDTACLEDLDPSNIVRNRADVVVDFIVEAIRAGADGVYAVLCRGEVIYVQRGTAINGYEDAGRLRHFVIGGGGLKSVLDRFRGRIIYLVEDGADISTVDIPGDALIVVGDQDGLSRSDERLLDEYGAVRVSIGPLPYISWFCPVFVSWFINRRGR